MTSRYGTLEILESIIDELRTALKSLGVGDEEIVYFTSARIGKSPRRPGSDYEGGDLYALAEQLGADRELLAAIGSWGDTLNADEILELLQKWNRAHSMART